MGELLGLPEWLAFTLFLIAGLILLFAIATRNINRQIDVTLAHRSNSTRAEFLAAMSRDVSDEASEFLWGRATVDLGYFAKKLTPRPDDHLKHDLPIDEDEWGMDWPDEWAEQQGFHSSNLPEWPSDWELTIRNYGRWLDMGSEL